MRGLLGVCNTLTLNGSWVLSLALVSAFDLKICLVLLAIPNVIFLVLSYFFPESPLWLVKTDNIDAAEKVLGYIREKLYPCTPELKELLLVSNQQQSLNGSNMEKLKVLMSRRNLLPTVVVGIIFIYQAS